MSATWWNAQQLDIAGLVGVAELSDGAASIARECKEPANVVAQLVKEKFWIDASRFLAFALLPFDRILWAHTCVSHLHTFSSEAECELNGDIGKWLLGPGDEILHSVFSTAQAVGFDMVAGILAGALFSTGGSIAKEVSSQMAAAAVLVTVLEKPEQAQTRWQFCIEAGLFAASRQLALPVSGVGVNCRNHPRERF